MSRSTDLQAAVVEELRSVPGLAARLLAEHARGADGRCPRCFNGAQNGRPRWLCRVYSYAASAAEE